MSDQIVDAAMARGLNADARLCPSPPHVAYSERLCFMSVIYIHHLQPYDIVDHSLFVSLRPFLDKSRRE